MQEIIARIFVIFLILFYATIAMAFIVTGFRNWIWRPLVRKFSPQHHADSYGHIKSPSHEESPS